MSPLASTQFSTFYESMTGIEIWWVIICVFAMATKRMADEAIKSGKVVIQNASGKVVIQNASEFITWTQSM